MCPWNASSFGPAAAVATATRVAAPARSMTRRMVTSALLVEADVEAVAILDPVLLSFETQPAAVACHLLAPRLEQLVPRNDLGADEALGEIAVDLPRRGHGAVATVNGPRSHLVLAHREERHEPEQLVAGADHQRESVFADAELRAEAIAIRGRQRQHLALEQRSQHHTAAV